MSEVGYLSETSAVPSVAKHAIPKVEIISVTDDPNELVYSPRCDQCQLNQRECIFVQRRSKCFACHTRSIYCTSDGVSRNELFKDPDFLRLPDSVRVSNIAMHYRERRKLIGRYGAESHHTKSLQSDKWKMQKRRQELSARLKSKRFQRTASSQMKRHAHHVSIPSHGAPGNGTVLTDPIFFQAYLQMDDLVSSYSQLLTRAPAGDEHRAVKAICHSLLVAKKNIKAMSKDRKI